VAPTIPTVYDEADISRDDDEEEDDDDLKAPKGLFEEKR
jgi:hypothetical protein